jgi:putative flippase GtrA
MSDFIKVQLASILGSLVDYIVTILLTEVFACWYLAANLAGNIFGGTVQFLLCKNWVFKNASGKMHIQATKFVLVFAGNLLLSALGVYILTSFLRINYLISKTITSVILGVSYNYYMQKKFVFAR